MEVEFEEGVLDLIRNARNKEFLVIIVSNQSGIERGFLTWDDYFKVTDKIIEKIYPEELIDAFYANSTCPGSDSSNWRKPSPKMLQIASSKFDIDFKKSLMIGDRISDLQAGLRAGVKTVCHVLTGHGYSERNLILKSTKKNYFIDGINKTKIQFFDNLKGLQINSKNFEVYKK